ncbi:hypothetical protein [Pseudomonas sp. NPDC086566]|uniref:hypothetical protein n=1 Tax=Pseudomonas sp. NPDC086566 TaxID=3390647 RepID=UPI003D004F0E
MTIDKAKLRASAIDWGHHSMEITGDDMQALLDEIERLETWRTAFLAERDAQIRQRDQLQAENELMRALIGDVVIELRKANDWICREVGAVTKSATHWAVRLRERAEHIDAAMAKEATHD